MQSARMSFKISSMLGSNHPSKWQMEILREAYRLLLSNIRGIPGRGGLSGAWLLWLNTKFTGCYRIGCWLIGYNLPSSRGEKLTLANLSLHQAEGRLLIGCPWVVVLPRTACSFPVKWNWGLVPDRDIRSLPGRWFGSWVLSLLYIHHKYQIALDRALDSFWKGPGKIKSQWMGWNFQLTSFS